MVAHVYEPIEGRRQDWALYVRSALDNQLHIALLVRGKQYSIYGDSWFNWGPFIEITFQKATLSDAQKHFNKTITAEWTWNWCLWRLSYIGRWKISKWSSQLGIQLLHLFTTVECWYATSENVSILIGLRITSAAGPMHWKNTLVLSKILYISLLVL